MANEKWLSEIVDNNDLQTGKLNLIVSPCGSGKTSWAQTLVKEDIFETLYLIDSRRGKDSLKKRFGTMEENWYDGHWELVTDGMRIMTYAGWMYCMIKNPDGWHWEEDSTIICDELDSCIRYSEIKSDVLHLQAIAELHKRIAQKTNTIVAITATPAKVKKEFKGEIYEVELKGTPKSYKNGTVIEYSNLNNIIKQLLNDKRGVIYVPHITQIQEYEMLFETQGIKAMGIWSENRKDDKEMDLEHKWLSEYIVENEAIPDDIQVLLINASSQTCININTPVDYICINDTNEDVQTQVRGRIRSDVETVYIQSRKAKCTIMPEQIEPWLNKKLYRADKNELIAEIGAKNENNRKIGWTTIKRELEDNGYTVADKRENHGSTQYSIISRV